VKEVAHSLRTIGAKALTAFTWIAFASFLVFLLAQHSMVFPYHDDWGTAVLDYVGEQSGFVGQNFTLLHVIGFLRGMYQNWSGRIVALFLQIYLFKCGLWYVRAFQVLAIASISFLAVKIALAGRLNRALALLPIVLYLSLPQGVLIDGLYWFSASAGYLWGIAPFTLAAYSLSSSNRVGLSSAALLAIASTFHEQMGIAVVSFSVFYLLLSHRQAPGTQSTTQKIAYLSAVPILALATILAPGNFNRKSHSQFPGGGVLDLVLANGKSICNVLVSDGSLYFLALILSLLCLWVSGGRLGEMSKKELVVNGIGGLYLIAASYFGLSVTAILLFIFMFAHELFRACRTIQNGPVVFSLFIASLASLVPLLLAPGVPHRSFVIFYFLSFVPIIFSLSRVTHGALRIAAALALCPVLVLGFLNTRIVFRGYRDNDAVNTVNHYRLATASFDNLTGSLAGRDIILNRLPSPVYAGTMPYQRPLIEKWIKKFYALPPGVNFVWK
jgi:hypothetical protein